MSRTAAWLVPAPLRGSGGHRTIYQNIRALAHAGWECHVHLEAADDYTTVADGQSLAEDYFGAVPATFHLGFELDRDVDVAFATAWFTADALRRTRRARHKAYFIQDYEPYFMPMSDQFVQAQNTYRQHFHGISIGRWLVSRLGREFEMPCASFDFCADHDVYRPLDDVAREPAICFVYQPEKPRRCSLVGAQALAIVKRLRPETQIYFYGSDQRAVVPYAVRQLGLLSIEECNRLYNRAAVGLCISTTNPSRIPFEMLSAGLPVVDVYGENNLYDMPDDAVMLAEPTPESIAQALLTLLDDPSARAARSQAGRAFMRERNLAHGFAQFTDFADRLARGEAADRPDAIEPCYRRPPVVVPAELRERYAEALEGWSARFEEATPPPVTPRRNLVGRTAHRLQHTLRVLLTGR
jgi:glycosyltransferase involved in cell wall biosynthesis